MILVVYTMTMLSLYLTRTVLRRHTKHKWRKKNCNRKFELMKFISKTSRHIKQFFFVFAFCFCLFFFRFILYLFRGQLTREKRRPKPYGPIWWTNTFILKMPVFPFQFNFFVLFNFSFFLLAPWSLSHCIPYLKHGCTVFYRCLYHFEIYHVWLSLAVSFSLSLSHTPEDFHSFLSATVSILMWPLLTIQPKSIFHSDINVVFFIVILSEE